MSTIADPISAYRAELRAAATRCARARRRRVLIAVAVAVVGVLTGSLAIAATTAGWLTGEPAPPQPIEGFRQYTPQLGFHPQAGKAQFVAQDGPIKLYGTANREGGICYLVDEPWKPAHAGDGGTCASRERASVPISAGGLGHRRTFRSSADASPTSALRRSASPRRPASPSCGRWVRAASTSRRCRGLVVRPPTGTRYSSRSGRTAQSSRKRGS